ncbi:hypothetical protein D3C71_1365960 [compost metagenome]
MEIKYYVVAAYDTGFGQGDELHLLKLDDGRLVGYSSEFDTCTTDIEDACAVDKTHHAKWFGWNDMWTWRAATLEEIRDQKLDKYLIGSKRDMKTSTPIESIY